jgi:hypothetical protein
VAAASYEQLALSLEAFALEQFSPGLIVLLLRPASHALQV